MVNAQEWLENKYPLENRKEVNKISLRLEKLTGNLKIDNWANLEEIDGANNYFDQIVINQCPKLKKLNLFHSGITSIDFLSNLNFEKLNHLDLSHNNLSLCDLSAFSNFTNLEELDISDSNLTGDLASFNSCRKLKNLKILNNPKIEGNLEDLPASLEIIYCNDKWSKQLQKYKLGQYWNRGSFFDHYNYQAWRNDNWELIELKQQVKKLQTELEFEKSQNIQLERENIFYQTLFNNFLTTKKQELENLKVRLTSQEKEWLETYSEALREPFQTPFIRKQINKAEAKLRGKIPEEELELILNKEKEIFELEVQLNNLQVEETLTFIETPTSSSVFN